MNVVVSVTINVITQAVAKTAPLDCEFESDFESVPKIYN